MTKLEVRVAQLEREMVEVRKLASGAHEDVGTVQATLRAHINTLEALNENQVKMRNDITGLRKDVDGLSKDVDGLRKDVDGLRKDVDILRHDVDSGFVEMREGFAEMREGFTKIGLGMSQITALITIAIGKDDTGD